MFRSMTPLHCLHQLDIRQASIRWQSNERDKHGQPPYFQTVDLILSDVLTTAAKLPLQEPQLQLIQGHSKLEIARTRDSAFLTSVTNNVMKESSHDVAIKIVLPVEDDYVVRSDYLEQSLYGCPKVVRGSNAMNGGS